MPELKLAAPPQSWLNIHATPFTIRKLPSPPIAIGPSCELNPGLDGKMTGYPDTWDECFKRAANRYGLDWRVLKAIAIKENSSGNERLINDFGFVGLMQVGPQFVNKGELSAAAGIPINTRTDLIKELQNGCTNIMAGAFIYKTNSARARQFGLNSLEDSFAFYTAGDTALSSRHETAYRYATDVRENYERLTSI